MRAAIAVLSYVGVLIAAIPTASACELCAVYSASQLQGQSTTGPTVALAEQFTHAGSIRVDGREIPNPAGQYLDSSTTQLVPGYHFTDRLGVEAAVPFIYRHFRRFEPPAVHTGDESGLGDLSLFGTYEVYRQNTMKSSLTVDVFAGVKFPTGSTSRLREETHESAEHTPSAVHGHDLTLGTGSYDALLGARLFARWHKLFGNARIQYVARTTGDYDYRFGDDTIWSAGPGYFLFASDAFTLSLAFNASGETKALDQLRGATVVDTGFFGVYVGPELAVTAGERFSAAVGVDIPVLFDNTALQIVPDYRVRAGLSWRF